MFLFWYIAWIRGLETFYSPTPLVNLDNENSFEENYLLNGLPKINEDSNPFNDEIKDIYPYESLEDSETIEGNKVLPNLEIKAPKNAFRSIRYGKIKTNPENLETLIHKEMDDISPDLHYKISKKLARRNVDTNKYRDLFLIKKRVIQDGKKKIVSFDIKEKIIPKNGENIDGINKDFGLRAILAGILFLLAGLVFTTTMKMYQNIFRKKYMNFESKGEETQKVNFN